MAQPLDILVIDDEEAICFAFQRYFGGRGMGVRVAATGADGVAAYRQAPADVVFLDVRLPDADGLDVLDRLREVDPQARVVVITAYGSLETVTRAIRGRAFDYLVKPVDLGRAAELVQGALEARGAPRAAGADAPPLSDAATLVGRSGAIQEVYKRIVRVATSDVTVLILGETGTGKDLVARVIHEHSPRRGRPFVAVNCGALPESLVEGELFGYVRGAFTGADADKPGRFEAADGGTLFLDEAGDLPLAVQVKLLRFLDTQTVERLGSVKPVQLDVRVVAATHCDLGRAVDEGRFRQDLYYRLAVVQVRLPRLADRREDILPLAEHFLRQRSAAGTKGGPPALSDDAARLLEAYAWPGNVRELRNALEHATVVSGGGPILSAHLPDTIRLGLPGVTAGGRDGPDDLLARYLDALPPGGRDRLRLATEAVERGLIRRALQETGGNHSAAAERLGIHRNTLRHRIRELGLGD